MAFFLPRGLTLPRASRGILEAYIGLSILSIRMPDRLTYIPVLLPLWDL